MKINLNFITSFVAGTLSTFFFIVFFKPIFLVPQNSSNKNDGTTPKVGKQNNKKKTAECDQDCVMSVLNRLISGKNLSYEYGPNVRNIEGQNVAKYISDKPAQTTKIEATLKTLKSQNDRDSILYVLAHLPLEQSIPIAQRLLTSSNRLDQFDGLYLLTSANSRGATVKDQLSNTINNSDYFKVVIKAITLMSEYYPDFLEDASKKRLNSFISDHTNKRSQTKALITKARLFNTNDDVKRDIITALTSKSHYYQKAGLIALDYVTNRQNRDLLVVHWTYSDALKEIITSIANDESAAAQNRVKALNLMIQHY